MEINGSLLQAMQKVSSSLAVLVIDESGHGKVGMSHVTSQRASFFPGDDVTWAQQRVIMLARAYNCPIAFTQFDLTQPIGYYEYRYGKHDYCLDTRSPYSIKTQLRALLPMSTRVINKHTQNAFTNTPLRYWLKCQYQKRGVENLVVIGFDSNKCIPATINPQKNGANNGGALSYKYNVLTCQQVLNGPPVYWSKIGEHLEFYSDL